MNSTKLLGIAIFVALFAGLAVVPALDSPAINAYAEKPKDNPSDDDQGGGNDPPNNKKKGNHPSRNG